MRLLHRLVPGVGYARHPRLRHHPHILALQTGLQEVVQLHPLRVLIQLEEGQLVDGLPDARVPQETPRRPQRLHNIVIRLVNRIRVHRREKGPERTLRNRSGNEV